MIRITKSTLQMLGLRSAFCCKNPFTQRENKARYNLLYLALFLICNKQKIKIYVIFANNITKIIVFSNVL